MNILLWLKTVAFFPPQLSGNRIQCAHLHTYTATMQFDPSVYASNFASPSLVYELDAQDALKYATAKIQVIPERLCVIQLKHRAVVERSDSRD